jgi:KDO2-lipid IV(A) lauroyltransferase
MTHFLLWLLRLFGRAPLSVVRALGVLLGAAFYIFGRERRHVTLTNLRNCWPDRPSAWHHAIAKAHFRVFAQALLDRGWLWWGNPQKIGKRLKWVGYEHFEAARAQGPVIMLAPHFVGLDAGGVLATMTFRLVSIYSRQKNRTFDAAILAARSRYNQPVLLSRQDGIRGALKSLRQGLPFYYLPDMDFGRRDAIFVPFFGVSAATVTATARLARASGALVVPCVTRMTTQGYEVQIYPAWKDYPGDSDDLATRRMNEFIEDRIVEMPEQYLWTHKRFKTRPEGTPSIYFR